jgi:DNA repair exonuclease SbcCD nuclease subunit
MTRVIHTGDTHIGYQQYHASERREDFMRAFERVIDDAVAENVDAVVHAGDLFHDRRPELPDLLGTISALRTLEEADIPFLAIVGNHESTRGGQWLDLFERLGLARRLDSAPLVVGDVALYGLDHVPRSQRDDLEYEFTDHDAGFAALAAHGLFQPFAHGDWDAETVLTQATVDFDALLLGDNHVAETTTVADTWVTYCGSTERASASEREARGYNLVEFDPEETPDDEAAADPPTGVDVRRRSLDDTTRDFAFVSVELASGEGVDRVREQLRQHELEDAVAIVELTGEGEPVTPAEIESFALDKGALIARVTDRREETTVEAELSVNFADPDDAVRERIEAMGLSSAARDLDETVRASKTADSNVRERVRSRVEELLEDPSAFESADGAEEDDAAKATAGGADTAVESGDSPGAAVADDAGADAVADDAGADAVADDAAADPDAAEADPDDSSTDPDDTETPSEETPDEQPQDQASMEEYL